MRRILPELTDELLVHFGDTSRVSSAEPFPVKTFRELVEHTAKLAFKNKDHLIFYRGQSTDFKNKASNSSFYPSIYRGDYLPIRELTNRFDILEGASKALIELFEKNKIEGYKELKRRKAVQWSLLQHYEVCHTPYLDFTHSLRVACSFATLDNNEKYAYVFVFGLPYLTNRITINSEHDLINIRLLSICPPTALRPYFQEGYLAGTDDITINYDSKTELDFNNRLIAKFKIPNNESFWGRGFDQIPKSSLYPDKDPIYELCQEIKIIANKELKTGEFGEFLKTWGELEEILILKTRKQTERYLSSREAIRYLFERGVIDKIQSYQIERIRTFRNSLIYTSKKATIEQIQEYLNILKDITMRLKS